MEMKPPSDNWKNLHILWSSWESSTTCYHLWRSNTAGHNQSGRFPDCIDENFLTHTIKQLKRGCGLFEIGLTEKKEFVGAVKIRGNLSRIVTFMIPREGNKSKKKKKTGSGLQKSRIWLVQRSAWMNPRGDGEKIFKQTLLQWSIKTSRK